MSKFIKRLGNLPKPTIVNSLTQANGQVLLNREERAELIKKIIETGFFSEKANPGDVLEIDITVSNE